MANPNLSVHLPIIAVQTRSGIQELIQNYLEAAGQTFLFGTPVQLNIAGNVVPWDGVTLTRKILGIAMIQGFNYATAGAGASPLLGSIGFPGGTPTFGSVQGQPSAVNLLAGSPFTNGLSMVAQAVQDTIFEGQVDASAGAVFAATTALVGTELGLTIDANGTWYVDLSKNTPGANTVLKIISLNPLDLSGTSTTTQVNNGRVRFTFNIAASSVQGG